MKRRNNNITKYKKPINFNIGMAIFGFIFLYIIISIILYIFSDQISVYEVKKGKLAADYKYQGFMLKEETIVTAQDSGNITYYVREGEKVGCSSLVYSLDSTGRLSELLKSNDGSSDVLNKKELNQIQKDITDFSYGYNNIDFDNVYDFKYDINEKILSSINLNALESISEDSFTGDTSKILNTFNAQAAGMVVYSTDGYEGVTEDTFTYSYLDNSDYQQINHNISETVNTGDIVYKLVSSENWDLIIEIDETLQKKLKDTKNIEVKFLKDDTTTWAGISIFKKDGKIFAKLSFTNSLVRFSAERYLDIELQVNDEEGLKIPTSAITKKDFFIIPLEYITQGGDSNDKGFIIEKYDENQVATAEFTPTTIYYSDDTVCYVDTSCFKEGDSIIKPDSSDHYQIGKKKDLVGVYNINKGFASFKQIDILYKNEEYCIIKSGTDYGLALYDHIALDSNSINEDDIID